MIITTRAKIAKSDMTETVFGEKIFGITSDDFSDEI